jgi:hypothetical protein
MLKPHACNLFKSYDKIYRIGFFRFLMDIGLRKIKFRPSRLGLQLKILTSFPSEPDIISSPDPKPYRKAITNTVHLLIFAPCNKKG